jgi:hypothetical protein
MGEPPPPPPHPATKATNSNPESHFSGRVILANLLILFSLKLTQKNISADHWIITAGVLRIILLTTIANFRLYKSETQQNFK